MANVRSGNTFYVDSTGTLTSIGTKVSYILLSSTGANATVTLQDENTSANVMTLKIDAAHGSQLFDFSRIPLFFPGGVKISAISNAVATVVYNERGG